HSPPRLFWRAPSRPASGAGRRRLFIQHRSDRLAHRVARVPTHVLRPAGAIHGAEELDVVELWRRKAGQVIAEEELQRRTGDRMRDRNWHAAELAEDGAQRNLAWTDDVVDARRFRTQRFHHRP